MADLIKRAAFYSLIWDRHGAHGVRVEERASFYSLIWDHGRGWFFNPRMEPALSIPLYGIKTVLITLCAYWQFLQLSIPLYGIYIDVHWKSPRAMRRFLFPYMGSPPYIKWWHQHGDGQAFYSLIWDPVV